MSEPLPNAVDLRSDTVTRPTPGMREAMMRAPLGDDVLGDDPTVQALERRMAELAGADAALYVPSGTMGNQLAVACQTRPADEVLLEHEAHVFRYEQGGIAANAGVLAHVVKGDAGRLPLEAVRDAFETRNAEDDHVARLALVCLENTHNRHGGAVVPLAHVREVAAIAHAHGARVHLDGARLWNAIVATGVPLAEWAGVVDSVSLCFSKALGAPVGSALVGDAAFVARARRTRKRWGGGMRQAGLLAGACLYALEHHVERLAEDHRRARRLAEGLRALPGLAVPAPETNIVMIDLEDPALKPPALQNALEAEGVRLFAFGPRRLRAITHLDVDDAGIERAIEGFARVLEARVEARGRG